MRQRLADRLFLLALRLDPVTVVTASFHLAFMMEPAIRRELDAAKPKKKRGRPLGSKNKPKVQS